MNGITQMSKRALLGFIWSITLFLLLSSVALAQDDTTPLETGYASVNDLEMYYEIYGTGQPLVMLHGGYGSIPSLGELLPRLAETRQIIAVELQGHGRTADVDRPLTYEQMADDVAGLMSEIGVEQADVFGVSMGGAVALQVAIRHPEVVHKLIVVSAAYTSEGFQPGMLDVIPMITAEVFAGSQVEVDYMRLAPHPENFPILVEKVGELTTRPLNWLAEDIQGIESPTFLIFGDADAVTLEHAVEMFRLLGGGGNGDMNGLPNVQLAILPGTTHLGVLNRVDSLDTMINEFLDVPMPEGQ
jgi:pimeloyl-ACP methyl ester carboxylesterase